MALEISEAPQFHRREWIAQRIGWIGILLIVCVGATGLAGRGPLGERHIRSDALAITYDWVMRYHAPGTIELRVDTTYVQDTLVRIWATNAFVDGCDPQRLVPQPAETALSGDTLIFTFPLTRATPRGRIRIECEPHRLGRYQPSFGIVGGPTHTFTIVVLP